MKNINKFLLILVGVCLILGLCACTNKKDKVQETGKAFKEQTVTVNYKDTVNLLEYFGEKDNFANTKLYSPDGTQMSVGEGSLYTDTMGTYKLMLYGSELTYNLKVEDIVGPYVMLKEQSQTVYWGDTILINPSILDNIDSEFDLESLKYTVTKRGWDVELNKNTFVADELGEYIIKFELSDSAGNEAQTYSINCVMPKKIIKPVGTKITVSDKIFIGIIDAEKNYTYEKSITKITEEGESKVKGNSFTIDKSSVYKIRQVAICGEEQMVLEYIYCSDSFTIYDFNDGDISVLSTTTEPVLTGTMSLTEVAEGDYAALVKCSGRNGWNTLYISGLEPNTTYDRIAFDVNLFTIPGVPGSIKVAFFNKQGDHGHTIFFETGKAQAVFSNITTNELGTATVFAYMHETGVTEYTIDNLIIQKSTAVNVEKGVYLAFAGSAAKVREKANTTPGNEGYSILRLEGVSAGFNTFKVFATKQAGLKPNAQYKVTIDVAVEGAFPAFFEEHTGGNDFVLGEPGGQIAFMITTDAKGEFEKVWNTVYVNSLKYAELYNVDITQVLGSVYDKGVAIAANGQASSCVEKIITEGENAGKTYTGLASSGSGKVNFSIIVTKERGLKANTKYHVTVDVATDGPFPAFIGPGDCFIISSPGGTIEFDITTDGNGEFVQTYNDAYLQNATYADFTSVTITETVEKPSVYGKGITISADGAIKRVEKEITEGENAGKVYTSLASLGSGTVNFSISATKERGLKANTKYHVTVDVATDGLFPAFIGPGDCFIISTPGGTIEFDITTDGNGEFAQSYNGAYLQQASYLDFTNVTITETVEKASVYGKGITIAADGAIKRMEKEITEGENAGKVYTSLASLGSGRVNFSITATKERGLKANTNYHVTVDVATDGPFPAFIGPGDCFIISTPGGTIEFDITTDGNGEFAQSYNGAYLQNATYADFTSVTITETVEKASVYGKGITIAADGAIKRVEKEITEGENAGKVYTSLASLGSGRVNFSITATKERGLKANTKYHVTVDVATDGLFPAFIGPGDCFIISTPGGTIEFDITTDGNGEFAQLYNGAYLQQASYVDFTGITFKEVKGSVYGQGVTILADGTQSTRVEKEITEGENAGKTYTGLAATGSGKVNFAIIVTNEKGLKANTTYHVTVDVATDGPFPAFIGPSDCFIISSPGGTIEFDITTDGNGEFAQSYNGAYLQNATYADFTGITVAEKH